MRFKKKPIVLALAITLAASGAASFNYFDGTFTGSAQAAEAPIAPEVDVASVLVQQVSDYQDYSGRFEAVDKVDIRSQVTGTIVAVHFKDGALVKKGDRLFTIDPQPFEAALSKAKAQLTAAQARKGYADSDWERAQRLITNGAIAKRDFDQKKNEAKETDADVKGAQASVDTARINLAYTDIRSPVAGRVSRAEITIGNTVFVGASAPALTTVVSVSPIYAAFDVDEQAYLKFLGHKSQEGVGVLLGLANESGYSRKATVDSVDNRLDIRSGTIRVRARLDNPDGLLVPGLYARVRVGSSAPHSAVLVDDVAVGTDQAKKFVLVVTAHNSVEYREVTPGALHDGLREITQGLNAGERIVVNGLQRVRPGDSVSVRPVSMTSASSASQNAS